MVRVSSPAKLRPWSELTAKMVMGVVPGLVIKCFCELVELGVSGTWWQQSCDFLNSKPSVAILARLKSCDDAVENSLGMTFPRTNLQDQHKGTNAEHIEVPDVWEAAVARWAW